MVARIACAKLKVYGTVYMGICITSADSYSHDRCECREISS